MEGSDVFVDPDDMYEFDKIGQALPYHPGMILNAARQGIGTFGRILADSTCKTRLY
jgi:hypothetical protein